MRGADRAPGGRNDLAPELRLEARSPGSLRIPTRNVRNLNPAHVKEVAHAIARRGFVDPVLSTEDGSVIDGAVRVKAAQELGMSEIPCVIAAGHTEQERGLLRLAVNRLAEKGTWDVKNLRAEISELVIAEAPISITGFDDFEIDGLEACTSRVTETGPLEPNTSEAVSEIGDVFNMGPHRLICGDARDRAAIGRLMEGKQARLLLTDQPFNVPIGRHVTKGAHREFVQASGEMSEEEFFAFNEQWISVGLAHLIDGGVLGTFIDWRGLPSVAVAASSVGLRQLNLIVWSKANAGMGSLYRSQHELLSGVGPCGWTGLRLPL